MKKITLYVCLLIAGLSTACRKNQLTENQEVKFSSENKSSLVNPNLVTQTHNLNLIYFVPNDLDTLGGYRKRLSDLMIWGQNWFKDEMQRNGYGAKTFGLLPDESTGLVKIILIRGSLPKSSYPYSGGNGAIASEINAYFAAHPTEKTSEHTLIIIPRYSFQPNGTPSGGPFYGNGTWCYALDYEGMDIKNLGKTDTEGNRFSVWFGGMMHELGHGLNLPHNCQKVSEDATLGMALMWAGNGTLGKSPTFLTATDAAILNVNQIFNNDNKTYYGAVTASIDKIHASYSSTKGAIVVSGKYATSVKVNSIVYYNDPNVNNEGTGGNKDYNATTWESKSIGLDSFYVEMPISDLKYKSDGIPYELKVKLVHENGTITQTIYNYTFSGGIPILTFSTKTELSKTEWTIASYSSEESSDGKAASLIDGNASTVWHSRWRTSPVSYPHTVVIKVGNNSKTASGLSLLQRSNLSRTVKDFEILTSTDGINFTSQGNYVANKISGVQYFGFASAQTFQYFKIIAKSAHDGQQFACLAELGLY